MKGAGFIAKATVRGRLYRIDWYPGLILGSEGSEVIGEIYEVDGAQLVALDDYEGEEYRRIEAEVFATDGCHKVWIWEWMGVPPDDRHLPGGDWLA